MNYSLVVSRNRQFYKFSSPELIHAYPLQWREVCWAALARSNDPVWRSESTLIDRPCRRFRTFRFSLPFSDSPAWPLLGNWRATSWGNLDPDEPRPRPIKYRSKSTSPFVETLHLHVSLVSWSVSRSILAGRNRSTISSIIEDINSECRVCSKKLDTVRSRIGSNFAQFRQSTSFSSSPLTFLPLSSSISLLSLLTSHTKHQDDFRFFRPVSLATQEDSDRRRWRLRYGLRRSAQSQTGSIRSYSNRGELPSKYTKSLSKLILSKCNRLLRTVADKLFPSRSTGVVSERVGSIKVSKEVRTSITMFTITWRNNESKQNRSFQLSLHSSRLYTRTHLRLSHSVNLSFSFGKKEMFWTNLFPTEFVREHAEDIKRFKSALGTMSKLIWIFGLIPVKRSLRMFRFSDEWVRILESELENCSRAYLLAGLSNEWSTRRL